MTQLCTFESFSTHYVKKMLSQVDFKKLSTDPCYANKIFFHYWAFERAGATKGFRVAAVKTIAETKCKCLNQQNYADVFQEFLNDKLNEKNNPFFDPPNINRFDVIQVINDITNGNLQNAFDKLALKGINHKIRSFFIRDVIYLSNKENIIRWDYSKALFAFPVDTWVRQVLSNESVQFDRQLFNGIKDKKYGDLEKKDRELATAAILDCFNNCVSPIKLNMGIWYFASQCVGDANRLKQVLDSGDQAVIYEASPFDDLP